MNLVRLTYASRFAKGVGPHDVEEIVRVSREQNAKAGVTGVLCYAPGLFLQCLEGPSDEVNRIYHRIAADSRHKDLALLEFSEISDRKFGDWSMAYVRAKQLSGPQLGRFSGAQAFDPFAMNRREALEFLSALADQRDLLQAGAARPD